MLPRKVRFVAASLLALPTTVLGTPGSPAATLASPAAGLAFEPVHGAAPAAEIPERVPDAKAEPLTVHRSTTKNGLRFAWWLPKGYDGQAKTHLTVILHGTGLDYRWGPANHMPGRFRPDDVVISVDGPTPNGDTRLFMDTKQDVDAIHDCLEEWRSQFAVDRVFLYGHSQGSFFTTFYAGLRPKDVAGLVAHASGIWLQSRFDKSVGDVAISFLHGTHDPVVPFGQSVAARDEAQKQGLDLVHLRRIAYYNHWPNDVRASEELDWCEAMTTSDPARALVLAQRLLEPKVSPQEGYPTCVPFSGAREVLARFEEGHRRALAGASEAQRAQAAKLAAAVEAHGEEEVAAIRKALPKKLALDGEAWLGHLVPAHEDLRGLAAMEALAKKLDFDGLRKRQGPAAGRIFDAWYSSKPAAEIYGTIVEALPEAFLIEGYPAELPERMAEWHADAKKLGLKKPVLAKYENFERWKKAWSDGSRERQRAWQGWRPPKEK
jgi:predicted esterase